MEVTCMIQFSGGFAAVPPEAKARLAEQGWRESGGCLTYALEAALGGVDGPALELHKKIQLLRLPPAALEKSLPVTVLITAGGREAFCEPARFGLSGGKWGIRAGETGPPHFFDALRLRDKLIATLTAAGGE